MGRNVVSKPSNRDSISLSLAAGCGGIYVQDDWEGSGSLANKAYQGY